jgi:hypothetical protein
MMRTEILLSHYENWAKTTDNKWHKEYAEAMYEAVLNGDHIEVFKELGSRGKRLYDPENDITYNSVKEAAEAFKISEPVMSVNYLRYGLKKVFK